MGGSVVPLFVLPLFGLVRQIRNDFAIDPTTATFTLVLHTAPLVGGGGGGGFSYAMLAISVCRYVVHTC